MKALITLLKTNDSFALLIARQTLGLVMFPHGARQALGSFGGYGFSATMSFFRATAYPSVVCIFLPLPRNSQDQSDSSPGSSAVFLRSASASSCSWPHSPFTPRMDSL
jgi:hypothetical protein